MLLQMVARDWLCQSILADSPTQEQIIPELHESTLNRLPDDESDQAISMQSST
jgi:hypothetical protein